MCIKKLFRMSVKIRKCKKKHFVGQNCKFPLLKLKKNWPHKFSKANKIQLWLSRNLPNKHVRLISEGKDFFIKKRI